MKKNRDDNVLSLLEDRTNDYANKIALGIKTAYGWKEYTYIGLGRMSRKLARYLMNDLELKKGEKLAILSESKPEYGACVFASIISGLVTVPLDIKLTKYELKSILSDCEPTVMLVSQHYLQTALELKEELPSLKHIIIMDEPAYNQGLQSIYTIPSNYTFKWRHRARKSTLFIIYTSGTTGAPKGVEISFGNVLSQLNDLKIIREVLNVNDVRILSILPMNHLLEMTVGFSTFLNFGFSIYYSQSLKPKDILDTMRDKKIQFMLVVPAFLKLLKGAIEAEIKSMSPLKQKAFKFLYHFAKFIESNRIKKFLFCKIHKKFGGEFIGYISGGAPLDVEVGKFFKRIGFEVYQGYGLSETSPVVSVNVDNLKDVGSVGRPLKSLEAKIDKESGELLLRGPSVMKGYHNQPELTATVIDEEGWLHTGDIATINRIGHIHITGRIKNMIVLSGGKKVFPEEVEAILEKSDKFSEVCVTGFSRTFGEKDGTEDIAAVIVPKDDLIRNHSDEELNTIVRDEVKELSKYLTPYKRPINIIVRKEELPKTTTRKIKRNEVKQMLG